MAALRRWRKRLVSAVSNFRRMPKAAISLSFVRLNVAPLRLSVQTPAASLLTVSSILYREIVRRRSMISCE